MYFFSIRKIFGYYDAKAITVTSESEEISKHFLNNSAASDILGHITQ